MCMYDFMFLTITPKVTPRHCPKRVFLCRLGKSVTRTLHSNAVGGGMVFAGGNKIV